MSPSDVPNRFSITLIQNGMHSLNKGIQAFQRYSSTNNQMLLKDAIMQVHHGVELLLKEMLLRENPLLIYENLGDMTKKQEVADRAGVALFALPDPPKTVTYMDAVKRVGVHIKPKELDTSLVQDLTELNRVRNQVEHYAIDVDLDYVTRLLGSLHAPLTALFESQIGGVVKQFQTPQSDRAWAAVRQDAKAGLDAEKEVAQLLGAFRGQDVPGALFCTDGRLVLPEFVEILTNYYVPEYGIEVDVLARGNAESWVVEVKVGKRISASVLDSLFARGLYLKAMPWLVVFSPIPVSLRDAARQRRVLLTGPEEYARLRELL